MIEAFTPLLAVALASITLSHGATLFSNGDPGTPGLGFVSSPLSSQYIAAQFTVADAISIAAINVAGRYGATTQDDEFSIAIMADSGNSVPDQIVDDYVFSYVPSTRSALPFADSYMHRLNLSSEITLGAGTYWLAVANASNPSWSWLNSLSNGTVSASSSTLLISGYQPFNGAPVPFIFSLEGSVIPEPSALALGGLGLCLLARRKRR